jgi:hypothetical protein
MGCLIGLQPIYIQQNVSPYIGNIYTIYLEKENRSRKVSKTFS